MVAACSMARASISSSGADRDDRDVSRMLADLGYTIAGPWRFAQVLSLIHI